MMKPSERVIQIAQQVMAQQGKDQMDSSALFTALVRYLDEEWEKKQIKIIQTHDDLSKRNLSL